MRVKAVIAYDGTGFYGFQSQTTTPRTVMGALTRASQRLGIRSPIVGSGRTDRGVHATGQVIHFDLPPHWEDRTKLKTMFNRLLAPAIQFKSIAPVPDDFHARYDAKRRIYRYLLKSTPLTPFELPYCLHVPDLDPIPLVEALRLFEGRHDFALFHKRGSDPVSTVRTIHRIRLYPFHSYTALSLEADGFLRAQVRMTVAAALSAMRGELNLKQIEEQIAGKERYTTRLAPPQGLYLSRVVY